MADVRITETCASKKKNKKFFFFFALSASNLNPRSPGGALGTRATMSLSAERPPGREPREAPRTTAITSAHSEARRRPNGTEKGMFLPGHVTVTVASPHPCPARSLCAWHRAPFLPRSRRPGRSGGGRCVCGERGPWGRFLGKEKRVVAFPGSAAWLEGALLETRACVSPRKRVFTRSQALTWQTKHKK